MKSSGNMIINAIFIVFVIGGIMVSLVVADSPSPPHNFHGSLLINGGSASVDTEVKAMVNDVDSTYDGPYFTTVLGEYGSGLGRLQVDCETGDDIFFSVEVSPGVFENANEQAECVTGSLTELPLTVDYDSGECENGDTRSCPNQDGVCDGSFETCTDESWPGCDYSSLPDYQAEETICDGLDNDCDGDTDEGFNVGESCSVGLGACEASGTMVCTLDGTGTECDAVAGEPTTETCNGIDDDCDGTIDNGFPNLGESCSVGLGECEATGEFVCTQDESGTECDAVAGPPSDEICDSLDNDCDGSVDEGDVCAQACTDGDSDGYGDPASSGCTYPELDCDDSDVSVNPGATEICGNEIDDDCDGFTDYDDTDCYCIKIQNISVLDSNFQPATKIHPGEMYNIQVTNFNDCNYDIDSMQVVQISEDGEPLNIGTVTSTILAYDSSVITVGFILSSDTPLGELFNVEAFNWNHWITQDPGSWETLSESATTSFSSYST